MNQKIGLALLALFTLSASACLWWLSVAHFKGTMRISTLENSRSDRPAYCQAGVGHNPFVSGVKIGFAGTDELLIDYQPDLQNQFVVLRSESVSSTPLVFTKNICPVFQKSASWHRAPIYDPQFDAVDGSIDLDCPLPHNGRLEAHLDFINCEQQTGDF